MTRRLLFLFSALAMPGSVVMIVAGEWPAREWVNRGAISAVVVLALFAAFVALSLNSGRMARR